MIRLIGSVLCASVLAGCGMFGDDDTPDEQRRDFAADQEGQREDLAENQADERAGLEVDIAEERTEEHEAAQDHLARETEQTVEQRRELDTMIAAACAQVDARAWDICPLVHSEVASVSDVDDGVVVRLTRGTGTVDGLRHRLDCYRARAVVRGEGVAPNAQACLMDIPDVDMSVEGNDGRVEVELTSARAAGVTELRTRSRLL